MEVLNRSIHMIQILNIFKYRKVYSFLYEFWTPFLNLQGPLISFEYEKKCGAVGNLQLSWRVYSISGMISASAILQCSRYITMRGPNMEIVVCNFATRRLGFADPTGAGVRISNYCTQNVSHLEKHSFRAKI